jgi:hypothetical protein
MSRIPILCVLLFFICVSRASVANPSLNERLAQTRTTESTQCLSISGLRFVNATLAVLSATDDDVAVLSATQYTSRMGRFMSHMTQTMASGLSFCDAFARACSGLVGEWTEGRLPAPALEYRTHCENVMRATDEAAVYLYNGPAFRNELYRCLRVAMSIPLLSTE